MYECGVAGYACCDPSETSDYLGEGVCLQCEDAGGLLFKIGKYELFPMPVGAYQVAHEVSVQAMAGVIWRIIMLNANMVSLPRASSTIIRNR